MSCEDDLAYANQVLQQVQAGLAYQQASYNYWLLQVLTLQAQTGVSAAAGAATSTTGGAGTATRETVTQGEERRASDGDLSQLAGLDRTVKDMETRLDTLETK